MGHSYLADKRIKFFMAEAPPSLSGSGKMAYNLAVRLAVDALSVEIICFNYNNQLEKEEKREGVTIRRIRYYNNNLIFKIISLPGLIVNYLKELSKCDICFLYGFYMPGSEVIMLYKQRSKSRIIFVSTLLGDDDISTILKRTPFPLKVLRRKLFSRVTDYYAINEKFKSDWEMYFGNKIPVHLLTQGVDEKVYLPSEQSSRTTKRKELGIEDSEFVILSAGILIERKGYSEIFKALEQLEIPFRYIIAGSYTENVYHRSSKSEKEEMKMLHELGLKLLGEKITYLGNRSDMPEVYPIADLFLHGALAEGTPNAVLEAIACQIPLLVRRLDGMDFLLKDHNSAFIFDDSKEICTKIRWIYDNYQEAMDIAKNARKKILQGHTIDQVVYKLFEA